MGMQDFTDKVAAVTGTASGTARAMAERFARAGMAVLPAVNLPLASLP